MSLPERVELVCRTCGHAQPETVWRSINVTLDPELKQSLLNGEINVFACSACGTKALILQDLLYHDMAKGLVVWLRPTDGRDADTSDPSAGDLIARVWRHYLLRVVTSRNELIEKVLIFENDLDDRVLEVMKVALEQGGAEKGIEPGLLYAGMISRGVPAREELVFIQPATGSQWVMRKDKYDELAQVLQHYFDEPHDGQWTVVDREYAARVLSDLVRRGEDR